MAIEKYELRIGNIITGDIDGTPGRILQLFDECAQWTYDLLPSNSVGYNSTTYNYISGIPLSPELLEKCGFVKDGFNAWNISVSPWPETHLKDLSFAGDYLYLREGDLDKPRHQDSLCVIWNNDLRGVMPLHQLQNIYWWLSGNEITIQL